MVRMRLRIRVALWGLRCEGWMDEDMLVLEQGWETWIKVMDFGYSGWHIWRDCFDCISGQEQFRARFHCILRPKSESNIEALGEGLGEMGLNAPQTYHVERSEKGCDLFSCLPAIMDPMPYPRYPHLQSSIAPRRIDALRSSFPLPVPGFSSSLHR